MGLGPPPTPAQAHPLAKRIHDASGGIPLIVHDVVAAAIAGGTAGDEVLAIPESARAMVEQRLSNLSPAARRTIDALAILGDATVAALSHMTNAGDDDVRLP